MKKIFSTLVLSACVLMLSAQSKQKFPFTYKGKFKEVEVFGNIKVEMIPSTKTEVKVTVELEVPAEKPFKVDTSITDSAQVRILRQQHLLNKFVAKNNAVLVQFLGDTLKIILRKPKGDDKQVRTWIQVYYKDYSVSDFRAQEGATLYSNYTIKADSIIASVRTSGRFEATLSAKHVHLESGEKGWMNVIGNSQSLKVQGTTNGEIYLNEYNTKQMEVILSTNATARIPVPNYLRARVSTGAVLTYYGTLRENDIKEILGGKIKQGG
jgi:hypothetical protein